MERCIHLNHGVAVVKLSGFRLIMFRDETESGHITPTQEIWLADTDAKLLRDFLMVAYPQEAP